MNAVWRLKILKQEDRIRLVGILTWFVEQYGGFLFSRVIQDHLYKNLISGLRCRRNPPVYLTSMLVLCTRVTIDQIAVIEDHRGLPPPVAGTGLDISYEECKAILEVLTDIQKQRTGLKNQEVGVKSEKTYTLPTKSLVLEGMYFHDPDFLSQLFRKMSNLQHIELQYNGTLSVLRALSKYCRDLESLCFLEPHMKVSVQEKDILPILFGIPPMPDILVPSGLLDKFVEERKFRETFKPQFPNLKKLDLDELYFEEEMLHDVYILALILHPKLSCFGKLTGLTRRIIRKYRQLWNVVNNGSVCQISLTKAKFVDNMCDSPRDVETELKYLEEVVPMFWTLKSVELHKHYWKGKEVDKFCQIFANHVDALSLNDLPENEISCLSNITHLRLRFMRQYSFEQVHLILDNCFNLQTLSIHPVLLELSLPNHERGQELQHFRQMMDEDEEFPEDFIPLVEELIQEMPDLPVIPEENNIHLRDIRGAPAPYRPQRKYKIHHKLITLRIASMFEAAREPSEVFLRNLLERLPNLHNLCLGRWMGSLSQRRRYLTCTGNALVSVVTDQKRTKPLLTQLEQLCCLPSGTEQEMCLALARLTKTLPCLHTLVVPALDAFMLKPTLRYFQHTNINVQHKCATDQVFSQWEPEH